MYKYFATLAVLSLSSCATFFGPGHMTEAEWQEKTAEHNKNASNSKQTFVKKDSAKRVGATYEEFIAEFGEAQSTEFIDGVLYVHKEWANDFSIYAFRDGRLTGWVLDKEAAARALKPSVITSTSCTRYGNSVNCDSSTR